MGINLRKIFNRQYSRFLFSTLREDIGSPNQFHVLVSSFYSRYAVLQKCLWLSKTNWLVRLQIPTDNGSIHFT